MGKIPTERAWIKICLDLGFQPRHVKELRQLYRSTHPQFAEFDYGAGPPFAVRYHGIVVRGKGLRFKTPEAAEEWGLENYKGSFDGWEVISLAPPISNGESK